MRGIAKGIVGALIASMLSMSSANALTLHTVTFEENLPSGTSQVAFQTSAVSTTLTPLGSLVPSFNYPNHSFVSWNTQPTGSGTKYLNGAVFSFSSDTTLYAQWQSPNQVVTFRQNRTLSDQTYASEIKNAPSNLTLFSNLNPQFSNPGYGFVGWNTEASGKGTSYLDGAKYSFATSVTLYAQWVKVITTSSPLVLVGVVRHSRDQATIPVSYTHLTLPTILRV